MINSAQKRSWFKAGNAYDLGAATHTDAPISRPPRRLLPNTSTLARTNGVLSVGSPTRVGRCGDGARSTTKTPDSCFPVSKKNRRMFDFGAAHTTSVHQNNSTTIVSASIDSRRSETHPPKCFVILRLSLWKPAYGRHPLEKHHIRIGTPNLIRTPEDLYNT